MNKLYKLGFLLLVLPFIYSICLERKTLAELPQSTIDSDTTQIDFNQEIEIEEEKVQPSEANVTCTLANDGKKRRCFDGENEIEDEKLIFSDEVQIQ